MTDAGLQHASGTPGALRREYVEAILAPDARRARDLVLGAHEDGMNARDLYLKVLGPALHEVGSRWERAEIGVAQEHLATQVTQTVLAQLAGALTGRPAGPRGLTALVACSPGELHALGSQMVGDFLEADGWDVLALGPDVPPAELSALTAEERPSVVCLSTVLPANLLAAARAFTSLRALPDPPFIVAGGQAYAGDASRARAAGADVLVRDPEELLGVLAERFG